MSLGLNVDNWLNMAWMDFSFEFWPIGLYFWILHGMAYRKVGVDCVFFFRNFAMAVTGLILVGEHCGRNEGPPRAMHWRVELLKMLPLVCVSTRSVP